MPISAIVRRPDLQVRHGGTHHDVVKDYAEAMTSGWPEAMPPVEVVRVDTPDGQPTYLLTDGWHRLEAAELAGLERVPVVMAKPPEGLEPQDVALVVACRSNRAHGLRMTQADKRRVAELLLQAHPVWSNRRLAELADLSHTFLANVRDALEASGGIVATQAREGADGKTYTAPEQPRASAFDDASALAAFSGSWKGGDTPLDELEGHEGDERPVMPWDVEPPPPFGSLPGEEPVEEKPANVGRMAGEGVTTDDWHTPQDLIELCRTVLGGIDTDPASSRSAQDRVRAGRWYGKEEDGLRNPWVGRVFLNPPFSSIGEWVTQACNSIGADAEAICLVCHANTDAGWWHDLAAWPVAFSRGRVHYLRDGVPMTNAPRGSAVFLLGGDAAMARRFVKSFGGAGWDVRLPAKKGAA